MFPILPGGPRPCLFVCHIVQQVRSQVLHKIYKMKKNKRFDDALRIEETKKDVAEQIIQNINKGNFKKKRRSPMITWSSSQQEDNY